MVSFVEVLGWIILSFLGFKALCHFCHFIYLVCLMPVFGRNLDPRRYGPWAGKHGMLSIHLTSIIIICTMTFSDNWSD